MYSLTSISWSPARAKEPVELIVVLTARRQLTVDLGLNAHAVAFGGDMSDVEIHLAREHRAAATADPAHVGHVLRLVLPARVGEVTGDEDAAIVGKERVESVEVAGDCCLEEAQCDAFRRLEFRRVHRVIVPT